ncbi:hypothetical protein H5410_062669 [Solanum commersonii]|uniref:Uncharacterized protein n=1 Tax=Solanum commersonii TaxID=4109 RepID=A0A9J5WC58_SOLCO|nr:hypothetical protein H5410_062669 [Solanum commersonii]
MIFEHATNTCTHFCCDTKFCFCCKIDLESYVDINTHSTPYEIRNGPCNSTIQRRTPNVLVLKPLESRKTEEHKDVTTLDWNIDLESVDINTDSTPYEILSSDLMVLEGHTSEV